MPNTQTSKKDTKKEKKKTVGEEALSLSSAPDQEVNSVDLEREMHSDFEEELEEAIRRGKQQFAGVFYVVVLLKKERLLQNVIRQYFFPRKSCPTPEFDQCVYRYDPDGRELQFLWTVPDWGTVEKLVTFYHCVCDEQKDLADFCCMFKRGDLERMAKTLNLELA